MAFYERLIEICEEKGISPYSIQKNLGLSKSSTTQWRNGQEPRIDTLKKIANYLNVPVAFFTGTKSTKEPITTQALGSLVMMPVIGSVKAGTGLLAEETYTGEYIGIPVDAVHNNPSEYRVLSVVGDSMFPFFLEGKDKAVVHVQSTAESSEIVVAIVKGEGMLKKLVINDGVYELHSYNPMYPPIIMGEGDRIFGKVVRVERIL